MTLLDDRPVVLDPPHVPATPIDRADTGAPGHDGLAMALRVLVGLTWLFWSSRMYISTYSVPLAPELTMAYGIGGAGVLAAAVLLRSARSLRRLDAVLLAGTLLAAVAWVGSLLWGQPSYGTDEAAFLHGAANVLQLGHNPYTTDLFGTLDRFGVPPSAWTFTTSGEHVGNLGYPALSVLLVLPLLFVQGLAAPVVWANLLGFLLGAALIWRLLPPRLRNVVPLLVSFDAYGSAVSSGLFFGLVLPFAVLAVAGFERFVRPRRRLDRWVGPLALGLACAVRQDVWFLAPFLVVGVAAVTVAAGAGWRPTARFVTLAAVGFGVPNLPFLVWNPHAWVTGVLSPLIDSLMPLGQGLVGLSLYLGIGGGDLRFYTCAALLFTIAALVLTATSFVRLKLAVPVVPVLILITSTRSLAQYTLFAVLLLLVAVGTWQPEPAAVHGPAAVRGQAAQRRHRRALRGAAALGLLALAALGLALTSPAALKLGVTGLHSTGQQGTVDEITVAVRNDGDHPQRPIYIVGAGPYVGTPWLRAAGPAELPAHGSTTITLRAPNHWVMPPLDRGFRVYAVTDGPPSISGSGIRQVSDLRTRLTPLALDRPVAVGEPVELAVHVLDRFGRPLRRAGIRVELGQALYLPKGVIAGLTTIDGAPQGQSPVGALTGPDGIARLHVTALQQPSQEVFFQAWLAGDQPRGYSNQVSLWFGPLVSD